MLCSVLGGGQILWNYQGSLSTLQGNFAKISPLDGSPVTAFADFPWVYEVNPYSLPPYIQVHHDLVVILSESPAAAPAPALESPAPSPALAPALESPAPALESPAAAPRRRAPGAGRPVGSGSIPESEACRVRIHKTDRALVAELPQLKEFLSDYRARAAAGDGPRWSRLQAFFSELYEAFPELQPPP